MKGWIRSYRKMLVNPVVMKDAEHLAVWVWLLLNATHTPCDKMFGGKKVTLFNGQLITGRVKVAQELKISESKVERILKLFESEHQIEQQKSNKNRLITIVNWNKYQQSEQQNERQLNNNRTTTEQQLNTNNNINNNKENEKNDKEDNNTPLNPPKGKRTKKESNLVLLDAIFQEHPDVKLSNDVISVLREWMEYKDQRKEHYVKKGMQSVLNQVYKAEKEHGSEAVVERIRNSMASNYQGMTLDGLKTMKPTKQTNQQKNLQMLAEYQKKLEEEDE